MNKQETLRIPFSQGPTLAGKGDEMKKVFGSLMAGAVLLTASYASAAPTYQLVAPGTATQVAALVKASTSINQLPLASKPSLATASQSMTLNHLSSLGGKCPNAQTTCSFGALTSKKVVLLMGDSHALMWVPALVPSLAKAGYRLDLKWFPGCPIATFPLSSPTDTQSRCATWRTNVLATIKKTPPVAVIFSERTTNYLPNGNQPTTAEWTAALGTTFQSLKSVKTKVIIIRDMPVYNAVMPQCLAVHPTAVQECATAPINSLPANQDAHLGEQAAASAAKFGFVNPIPWLCAATCSPVIGNMIADYDSSHVSAVYASYLSTVMGTAIKPLL
jgi:hypothetical protein